MLQITTQQEREREIERERERERKREGEKEGGWDSGGESDQRWQKMELATEHDCRQKVIGSMERVMQNTARKVKK